MNYSMRNPSGQYVQALKDSQEHHRRSKTWSGVSLLDHALRIKAIVEEYDCHSILDYGCGKGTQYFSRNEQGSTFEEIIGREITKVDPGLPDDFLRPKGMPSDMVVKSSIPNGKFDLIIVTHVLSCIPVEDLRDWVVPMLHRRCGKVIYLAENLNIPKKDGLFKTVQDKPRGWTGSQWMDIATAPSDIHVEGWFCGMPNNDPRKTHEFGPDFRKFPFSD